MCYTVGAMNNTHPSVPYSRDGILVTPVARTTEFCKSNTVTIWTVRWDAKGKVTGKPYRACSPSTTSWTRVVNMVANHRGLNPSVEQDRCAGFVGSFSV